MTISFTQDEKIHAQAVVDRLLREHRFFISGADDFEYHFPANKFSMSLAKQSALLFSYQNIKDQAEADILAREKELGFSEPQVPKNRNIAQCNRFTGGFDMKSIFPLSFFTQGDVLSLGRIYKNLLKTKMGYKESNHFSPNDMESFTAWVEETRAKILFQWDTIQSNSNFDKLSVVLLESRFGLSDGRSNDDFSEGKLEGIEKYPELLGYLLYEKSKSYRFVQHNYIVFNTSRKSHIRIAHWTDKEPSISYSAKDGYSCKAHFASIF